MSLVLEIEFLTGVCRATREPGEDAPDWPPQPDRVFSALVSAWAARGERPEERVALEWLETQPLPTIHASNHTSRTTPDVFVPPNDPRASRTAKTYLQVMPNGRPRQPRRFPTARPDDPFMALVWPVEPAPALFDALNAIARCVGYLGHSASLARCRFLLATAPVQRHPSRPVRRRVYPGRLRELERAYHANSVRPTIRPGAPVFTSPGSIELSPNDWLVLEAIEGEVPDKGEVPDIRAAALVCRVLRQALMSGYRKAGLEDIIPEVVSGHALDGTPTRLPHLAIAPMAFAGFPHADGHLLGFALIPPREITLDSIRGFRAAFENVARYHPDKERRVLTLKGPPLNGLLHLTPAPDDRTRKRSLSPGPYLRPSRIWASATPIVLERHLKRKDDAEVRELVARACQNAGLSRPDPSRIRVDKHSAVEGMPPAQPLAGAPLWTRWKTPKSLASRQSIHAVIDFERDVSGPVLLGAGPVYWPWPLLRHGKLNMELRSDDFAGFFRSIHGHTPFPWQQDLVDRLAECDEWPDVLDLPTGAGKTAAMDAAVFHLALRADPPGKAALRIVFVVDRRLVVDDSFERSNKLAKALCCTPSTDVEGHEVVEEVARRLRRLAGEDAPPLVVRRLRGGAPLEHDWARTPTQPTILCSTVDQVGSRLLFRGYGVSDRMKPVHAGLLGVDSLILLDEAHLSEPFRQTLAAVRHVGGAGVHMALLSATPGVKAERRIVLSSADLSHHVLEKRLKAFKRVALDVVRGTPTAIAETFANVARAMADRLREQGVLPTAVGIVVNRVDLARGVFEVLRGDGTFDTTLMIGRSRSVDRDRIVEELAPFRTDAKIRSEAKSLFVVATQCLEVGVDLDLDGLVTQAAPLDALRQRFGRLNRGGRKVPAEGAILARSEDIAKKADDPVYGDRIRLTWEALQRLVKDGTVDFGIETLSERIKNISIDLDGLTAKTAKRSGRHASLPRPVVSYIAAAGGRPRHWVVSARLRTNAHRSIHCLA